MMLFLSVFQEREVMEAAVRAFEDWEFRVLEQESGLDEEDDGTLEKTKQRESEGEMEKEISCQQHAVNTAQVNGASGGFFREFLSCFLRLCTCLQLISVSCAPRPYLPP